MFVDKHQLHCPYNYTITHLSSSPSQCCNSFYSNDPKKTQQAPIIPSWNWFNSLWPSGNLNQQHSIFNSALPSAEYMSVNWVSIGSGNGLSPVQCQAITWTNAGLLLIGLLGTNFSEIQIKIKQGKSEGFDSCDRPSNLTQIRFKSSIFQPLWPWNFGGWPQKTIGHLVYATLSFLHHFIAIGEFKQELQSGNA